MLEGTRPLFRAGSIEFQTKHLLVIAVLALAFSCALIMRFYPIKYGYYLNEFDPYFDYRATKFIVDNGLTAEAILCDFVRIGEESRTSTAVESAPGRVGASSASAR